MRAEKQFLVDEVNQHLDKSEYVFLTDFSRLNIEDTAELRGLLAEKEAEFHVVKNNIFKVASRERNLPVDEEVLNGQTAIVVGGPNPSEVAKVLFKFFKDKEKVEVKTGVLGDKSLSRDEVEALSKLPSLEALRSQLLGLFSQPGTSMVRVLIAGPQDFVNVLQAKVRAEGGEA